MKSLKVLQTMGKIGQILSKIVWICCVVGICGCAVGIVVLAGGATVLRLGGESLQALILEASGYHVATLYTIMAAGMVLCLGQLLLGRRAERYFAHEVAAGTPFTLDGAKELWDLGIATICIPLAALILAEIVQGVLTSVLPEAEKLDLEGGTSIVLGCVFLVVSLLCRCAAEQLEKRQE